MGHPMKYFEVETADPDAAGPSWDLSKASSGQAQAQSQSQFESSDKENGLQHGSNPRGNSRFLHSLEDMGSWRVYLGLAAIWLLSFAALYSVLRKIFPALTSASYAASFYVQGSSFFEIHWAAKDAAQLAFEIPIGFLSSPRMFLVDVMFAKSVLSDGKQTSMAHMPAKDTGFNVFEFRLAEGGAKQVVLSKPLMQLRSGNEEMDACMENVRNTFQLALDIKGISSKSILVDAKAYLLKLFMVKDAGKVKAVRVINVAAFPQNFNIHVEVVKTGATPSAETESEELIFAFQLLDQETMPARLATSEIGYFTRTFTDLGWSALAGNYTAQYPSIVDTVDAEVRVILRKKLPAIYYIDPSVPVKYQGYIKRGVENWQKAFDAAGLPNAVKAMLPSDADFPADYDAADMRYSTISWSVSTEQVFAIGPSTVDPRSGEVLNSDIVFAHGWVHSWLSQIDLASTISRPQSAIRNQHRLRGSPPCLKQQLTSAELGQVGEELTDANTLLELVGQGLTDVTMHEVGHTLGLRHNFKGSTGFPYAKRTNARYIEQHGMTASVMDYVPLNLMSSNTRGNRPLPPLFSPTVGEYDIHAIRYGYQPLEEGNVTIRNQTFELPLEDPSLARVVEEVFTYATDEDDPGMEGPDPFTTLFDFSDDPVAFFEDRLSLIKEIRSKGVLPKDIQRQGQVQLRLLRSVSLAARFLAKFIGGVELPKKSGKGQLVFVEANQQLHAWNKILSILGATGELGLFPKVSDWQTAVKPKGFDCHTLTAYCDGRELLDFPKLILQIKLQIIDALLQPSRIDRLLLQQHAQGNSLLPTLFANITGSILGDPLLLPFSLKSGYSPGKRLSKTSLWGLQASWLDRLRAEMKANEKRKSFQVVALVRQERLRVKKELSQIVGSPGVNKLPLLLRAHLSDLIRIADEQMDEPRRSQRVEGASETLLDSGDVGESE